MCLLFFGGFAAVFTAIVAYFVANAILTAIVAAVAIVGMIIVIPMIKVFFITASNLAKKEELEKNWDRSKVYGEAERPNLSEKLGKFHSEIKED